MSSINESFCPISQYHTKVQEVARVIAVTVWKKRMSRQWNWWQLHG